jgi:hypothetical protein
MGRPEGSLFGLGKRTFAHADAHVPNPSVLCCKRLLRLLVEWQLGCFSRSDRRLEKAVDGPRRSVYSSGNDYSSSAPSEGSSAASTFESRFMLMTWISAIRCLNLVPSTSSSTSRYRRVPSRVISCPF